MSILSIEQDGFGYFYGFLGEDPRQINVLPVTAEGLQVWLAFAGGVSVGDEAFPTKGAAEAAAIAYLQSHPVTLTDEEVPF